MLAAFNLAPIVHLWNWGFRQLNITPTSTEIHQIPLNTKKLDLAEAEEVLKIIDKFEEDDDIQTVFHNLELTEELIAQLEDN